MCRWTFIPIAIALNSVALGQVVNIESKRFADDTMKWSAQAGVKFNVAENTQRSISLGLNGSVRYVQDIHRVFFISDLSLDRVEENAYQNTGFQHVRYNRHLSGRWHGEAFTQLQYNKPLRIDERWLLGAGPRYVFHRSEDLRAALGTALMAEYEVDRVNDLYYSDLRSSSYVSLGWNMENNVQFTLILYYQPKVGEINDHRIAIESQLRIRATRRIAFDTRFNMQRDTRMAPGIPELNYRWENVLSFLF